MSSDAKKVLKTVVAVLASVGIFVCGLLFSTVAAAVRGPVSSDHLLAHKGMEATMKSLWDWVKK